MSVSSKLLHVRFGGPAPIGAAILKIARLVIASAFCEAIPLSTKEIALLRASQPHTKLLAMTFSSAVARRAAWAIVLLLAVFTLALASCTAVPSQPAATAPVAAGRTVTIMTHDSFAVSKEVVAAFQQQCNCQVRLDRKSVV